MNERFLFRGKQIDNSDWVDGFYCMATLNEAGKQKSFPAIQYEREPNWWVKDIIDPTTIGQCTGIKDKNGTLIFEGDIVKLCDTNPILMVASIEMKRYGWKCLLRYADDDKIVESCFLDKCEIIGNIHDNPELYRRRQNDTTTT